MIFMVSVDWLVVDNRLQFSEKSLNKTNEIAGFYLFMDKNYPKSCVCSTFGVSLGLGAIFCLRASGGFVNQIGN